MNGGTINQLTRDTDGVVMRVQGVGPLSHKFMILKILPTNYQFAEGDLVWWHGQQLHWEGRVSCQFERVPLETSFPAESLAPPESTAWDA